MSSSVLATQFYDSAKEVAQEVFKAFISNPCYSTPFVAGLATHAAVQFYEPQPVECLAAFLVSNVSIFQFLQSTSDEFNNFSSFLPLLLKIDLIYLTTLYSSIFIYRAFFHRTRNIPGPFWARISKFWAFYWVITGEYSRNALKLHKKYGDFVRVGPREIDCSNVHAINALYGSSTTALKGPWYEGSLMGSHERFLQNETPEEHQWKRRIWDAGFNSKALRGYEPRVLHFVGELINTLNKVKEEGPVDIGLYLSFFTFDIMGDLGFGKSFDMLKHGKEHDYMTIVQGFAKFNALICTIPWCGTMFAWLPRDKSAEALFTFAKERVAERLPLGMNIPDIFSTLLVTDRTTKKKYSEKHLILESLMLSIGGSDTTSSSLATIIYFLLAHPSCFARLKKEIDGYEGPLDHQNLSKFLYLNGVVREALRLMPPIGSGMMHRVTPPEGMTIDGTFIPGNTTIGVGAYAIQHDPRYYGKPDEFHPERWMGEGPEPFDRNAFMTFSHGPYSCVGKHLAYVELCDVTAALIRNFDMSFAPGYDPSAYEHSIKDSVISSRAHLPLILKNRA